MASQRLAAALFLMSSAAFLGAVTAQVMAPQVKQVLPRKAIPGALPKVECQTYQQMEDGEYRWNSYTCKVHTNLAQPMCIRLNCVGVAVGKPPIGGSGGGSNIIRPGPHSDNIGEGCVSETPVYPPNGAWFFNFFVSKDTPVRVTVAALYPPVGSSCDLTPTIPPQ